MVSMSSLFVFSALVSSFLNISMIITVDGGSKYGSGSKWSKYSSPTSSPTEESFDDCSDKNGYWTQLYNRENADNNGDDERLFKLKQDGENICNGYDPIDIECIELDDGEYQLFNEYDFDDEYDMLYCEPTKGFRCKGYNCPNFGVRFCCDNNDKTNIRKRSSSSSSSSDDGKDKDSSDRRR